MTTAELPSLETHPLFSAMTGAELSAFHRQLCAEHSACFQATLGHSTFSDEYEVLSRHLARISGQADAVFAEITRRYGTPDA